ncbi:uncharacterized protein LOC105183692 [Harpegnathos saltator]|uniref:uncharacterized protein LOC105183692 n=1 Tax=Harpegnathos saltator TaxID=610380 RepID=UPI000DBEDFC3|nr:uncharacterized protein LOC105183692 [Harpegnathos saltator]XP_025154751.1 uncharacterized protein LOC105183692 [Harpegnathos saltator]
MQQFIPSIHHQHGTPMSEKENFKNLTKSPVFFMENQRNLQSVQHSNDIPDSSAPMQLPLQSVRSKSISPILRSTPSPMLRSTPSPMLTSTPSPMLRSTPSPIEPSEPSSALLQPKIPVSKTDKPSTSAKTLNTHPFILFHCNEQAHKKAQSRLYGNCLC